jgi:hypothetical protein
MPEFDRIFGVGRIYSEALRTPSAEPAIETKHPDSWMAVTFG